MEIDEADAVKVCNNLTVTHMAVTSTDTTLQKGLFTHGKNSNTKGTQTPGHVFLGKLGEVIITSNYNLVKLVINDTALTRLADRNFNIEQLQDTVVTSLARLDWNGDRILDKAMTSFRLTLTNEMMPQLLKELTGVMKSEAERHQVQHLVEKLFDNYKVKLFGFDVASFVFILEHCSIDDAEMTSIVTEKQEQLQEILTTFLPVWVGQSAVWSASRYTLSSADLSRDFGYRDFSVVSMTATEQTSTSTSTSTSTGDQMDVVTKVKSTTSEDEQPMASSVAQQTLSAQTQSLVGATSLDHPSTRYVDQPSASDLDSSTAFLDPDLSSDPHLSSLTEGLVADPAQEVDSSAMEFPTEVDSSAMEFPTEVDSSAMEFPTEVDFRFIMLGRTGSGKSSTANTIFGQDVFPATLSFSSVTTECQLQTISKDGVSLQILDCPGLFDTGMTNEEVSGLVMKAVSTLDDGPDAVLYVIKIGKYTEEEFSVFNMLKALLDENVTRYLVIVFTHGDVIKGGDFDVILRRTPPTLHQVIEECGSRYVVFDNTAQDTTQQVDRLFQIVRRMKTENGGRPYRCPKYAEQLIEMDDELERRLAKVEKERQEKKRYVQQLRAELAQAERSLAEQREELKKKEEERKKDAQLLMQTMQQNVKKMSETLQADQKGKQDMEGELEALKEQAEKQKQHLHEKTEEEFRMFEEKLREKKNESERLAMQLREQGDSMERLMQAQMNEYSHLKTSVARSRKRRQKNCCVM